MHLKKLYAGINKVEFNPESSLILSMKSSDGEVVKFHKDVLVEELVEAWLGVLTHQM